MKIHFKAVAVAIAALGLAGLTKAHGSHHHHHDHDHHHDHPGYIRRGLQDADDEIIHDCGTPDPTDDQRAVMKEAYQTWIANNDVSSATVSSIGPIPLYWHSIAPMTASEDADFDTPVTEEEIKANVEAINKAYANTNVQFELKGTTSTKNDAWWTAEFGSPEELDMKSTLRQGTNCQALNIWSNKPSAPGLPPGTTLNGYATFPSDCEESPLLDGVVLGVHVTFGRPYFNGDTTFQGDTSIHEIGHWFGLFHPFQPSDDTGNSCAEPNDEVEDTPQQQVSRQCAMTVDTCPDDTGLDSIFNFMQYTGGDAEFAFCRQSFTAGQMTRIHAMYDMFRSGGPTAPPVPTPPPAPTPHATPPPTPVPPPVPVTECSLCPGGEDPPYPDRPVHSIDEVSFTTCWKLDEDIKWKHPPTCGYQGDFGVIIGTSAPYYCGCPSARAPAGCAGGLCGVGTGLFLNDPDKQLGGFSCADWNRMAESAVDDGFCSLYVPEVRMRCCTPATPEPTPAPTPKPTLPKPTTMKPTYGPQTLKPTMPDLKPTDKPTYPKPTTMKPTYGPQTLKPTMPEVKPTYKKHPTGWD